MVSYCCSGLHRRPVEFLGRLPVAQGRRRGVRPATGNAEADPRDHPKSVGRRSTLSGDGAAPTVSAQASDVPRYVQKSYVNKCQEPVTGAAHTSPNNFSCSDPRQLAPPNRKYKVSTTTLESREDDRQATEKRCSYRTKIIGDPLLHNAIKTKGSPMPGGAKR